MPVDISFCVFVNIHTDNVVSKIYSAREKEKERERVCGLYRGMRPIYLLCIGDEKQEQQKNTSSHYPYMKHWLCFVCGDMCTHTHTHTLTLLSICNKQNNTGFLTFHIPYSIYYLYSVCVFALFFSLFLFFCFIKCHFFDWNCCRCRHQQIIHHETVVVVVAVDCLFFKFLKFLIAAAHLKLQSSALFQRWSDVSSFQNKQRILGCHLLISSLESLQTWLFCFKLSPAFNYIR